MTNSSRASSRASQAPMVAYTQRPVFGPGANSATRSRVPLVTADTRATVTHRAVRRTSDARVLGVVGPRYAPLQNRDAFAWFQPFLDAREAALHTAGSLKSGSRIWVLAKLNRDTLVIAAGGTVGTFLRTRP